MRLSIIIIDLHFIGRPETFTVKGISHYWDGKIGIFPFVEYGEAKNPSKIDRKEHLL
jgi:hypothetical protein